MTRQQYLGQDPGEEGVVGDDALLGFQDSDALGEEGATPSVCRIGWRRTAAASLLCIGTLTFLSRQSSLQFQGFQAPSASSSVSSSSGETLHRNTDLGKSDFDVQQLFGDIDWASFGIDKEHSQRAEFPSDDEIRNAAANPEATMASLFAEKVEAPELCTDGTVFSFTMVLKLREIFGYQTILTSNADSLNVFLKDSRMFFKVATYNLGSVNVSLPVRDFVHYTATFEKMANSLCLTLCEHAPEGDCEASEPQCMYAPNGADAANFQVRATGPLAWGQARSSEVLSFQQHHGSVPISFSLANIKYSDLWDNEDEWHRLMQRLQESFAAVTQGDITPSDIHVTAVAPSHDGRDTSFLATIVQPPEHRGDPCGVEMRLKRAMVEIGTKDDLADSLLAAAIVERVGVARLEDSRGDGEVFITSAAVPAASVPCAGFRCRKSFPRSTMALGARCRGYSCEATCCDPAWSDSPLPYVPLAAAPEDDVTKVELSVQEGLAVTAKSKGLRLPPFAMPDLVEEMRFQAQATVEAFDRVWQIQEDQREGADYDRETASFTIEGLDLDTLRNDCQCEQEFVDVLRASIKEIMHHQGDVEQIQVNLLNDLGEDAKDPTSIMVYLPDEEEDILHMRREHGQKLKALLDGKVFRRPGDEKNLDVVTAMAEKGQQEGDGIILPTFSMGSKARSLAEDGTVVRTPRTLLSHPDSRLVVHLSFPDCGLLCSGIHMWFQDKKVPELLRQAVKSFVKQKESLAEPVTGPALLVVKNVSTPGQTLTCNRYKCAGTFSVRQSAHLRCFGSKCEEICCQPRSCAQVECAGKMRNVLLKSAERCSSSEECASKCCSVPCESYSCQPNSCPKQDSWMLSAPPDDAQEICCEEKKCCDAPTAACIGCMKCQTTQAYCESCFFNNPKIFGGRSLASEGQVGGSLGSDETSILPPRPTLGRQLQGTLPQGMLNDIEVDASQRQLRGASGSGRRAAEGADETKARLRQLQEDERQDLMEDLLKAEHFRRNHLVNNNPTPAPTSEQWTMTWQTMAMRGVSQFMGRTAAGCESVSVSSCPYYFQSVFLLHRGCGLKADAVNSVQVLTDTKHAVSCGDSGKCWVWKILDGKPRTVFAPHFGRVPMRSSAVLLDTMHILSAGGHDPFGGVAYVWDWRTGEKKAATRCWTGQYLATAEMPAWHTVLLGCADGSASIWKWDTPEIVRLPYVAQSKRNLMKLAQTLVGKCQDEARSALDRLSSGQSSVTEQAFMDSITSHEPDLRSEQSCMLGLANFFFRNTFGSTNAISYVPTDLRFVTGHGDGRVRYWNAHTGVLLKTMHGHKGAVRAVAGLPTRQEAVSGGEDGTIRVWCLDKGIQKMFFYQAYAGPVLSIAVYPGGVKAVVGSSDGYLRFWDLKSGVLLCAIETGGGPVLGLAINPAAPLGQVLTANEDGYVRVFNPR